MEVGIPIRIQAATLSISPRAPTSEPPVLVLSSSSIRNSSSENNQAHYTLLDAWIGAYFLIMSKASQPELKKVRVTYFSWVDLILNPLELTVHGQKAVRPSPRWS